MRPSFLEIARYFIEVSLAEGITYNFHAKNISRHEKTEKKRPPIHEK